MDTWVWIVIAVVALLVVVIGFAAWRARARRSGLEGRFGDEYNRTVESAESRRSAERDLRAREAEHDELELKPLSETARVRYAEEWRALQERFVDRPRASVIDADDLVTQVMDERGYPVDDFDTKSRLVSVDQPAVVENYRQGHAIALKARGEDASTEELRQAVVSYRALFDELLRDGADTPS